MKILLANDDGIESAGLRALYHALRKAGHEVIAVAPMEQQSGVSRGVTIFLPLRAEKWDEGNFRGYGISGKPADCVKLGLGELLPWTPDLVVSGINDGPNTGVEIFYSGTVGAASEACHTGIPTIAFSHAGKNGCDDWDNIASHAVSLIAKLDWSKLPPHRVINVNYPALPLAGCKGIRVCPLTSVIWANRYKHGVDPLGTGYWWFTVEYDKDAIQQGSDHDLISQGFITITPLMFDFNDDASMQALKNMRLENL